MARLIFTNPKIEGYSTEALLEMIKTLADSIEE